MKLRVVFLIGFLIWIGLVALVIFRLSHDDGPKLGDPKLFEDTNCVDSCWQGLQMGKTSKSEFEEFVDTSDYFEVESQTFDSDNEGFWFQTFSYAGSGVEFIFEGDVLVSIKFYSPSKITLKEIVAHLGLPSYFDAVSGTEIVGKGFLGEGVAPIFWIDLYYPEQGYFFSLPVSGKHVAETEMEVCFSENTEVDFLQILPVLTIEEMLSLPDGYYFIPSIVAYSINEYLVRFDEWVGYGCTVVPSEET